MSSAFSIMNRGPRGHVAGIKTKPTRSSAQVISKLTTKRGQHRTVSLHPSQTRIRWQSSKLASLSFVTVSRVSRTAFARVRRSLRDGFGDDSVVLEVGDFALVVGIELDDIGLKEKIEVATDAGDVAIEVIGEGADELDVAFTDAGDELLALLREDLLGGLSVGDEDVLETAGSEGTGQSGS
ncbi:hypothetical protein SAMN04487946_111100 [Halobellus clavatus]|uniref:Uncharacterized protein n=1 Tax=Halobellus clavatus TaxID=660517 RepID=A0A1H3J194_9EURY|nr:hypothetical protein SAMN04487946_111100 [Halobellus clavatus]